MKAVWNNQVLANSAQTVVIEGNHYFPPESLNQEFFEQSSTQTNCPWKGSANYYTIKVADAVNRDAAWYYAAPKEAASEIAGHVAFWKGVTVAAD